MEKLHGQWTNIMQLTSMDYECGHCGLRVGSKDGWDARVSVPQQRSSSRSEAVAHLRVCPQCNAPTYLSKDGQVPSVPVGSEIGALPDDVAGIYQEARLAISAGANTVGVLALRKLLMNISVHQGADAGKKFAYYVGYLADSGYVPPNGRGWVDHIRQKGNEATHEIALMSRQDAEELLAFTEMLLKFVYEFPSRIPTAEPEPQD